MPDGTLDTLSTRNGINVGKFYEQDLEKRQAARFVLKDEFDEKCKCFIT